MRTKIHHTPLVKCLYNFVADEEFGVRVERIRALAE